VPATALGCVLGSFAVGPLLLTQFAKSSKTLLRLGFSEAATV